MKLAEVDTYTTGGFNAAVAGEGLQLVALKAMQQVEACQYNSFLISIDALSSNLSNAVAAASNLATQIGVGFQNSDQSIYISFNKMKDGIDRKNNCDHASADWYDWHCIGYGFQLFLAEAVKKAAGEADIEVTPT